MISGVERARGVRVWTLKDLRKKTKNWETNELWVCVIHIFINVLKTWIRYNYILILNLSNFNYYYYWLF